MFGDTSNPRASALTNALENRINPHSSTVTSGTVTPAAFARHDLDFPYAFRSNLKLFAMSVFVAWYSARMGRKCYQILVVSAIELPQGPRRDLRQPLLPQRRLDGYLHVLHALELAEVYA